MKEAIDDFLAISEASGSSPHTIKSRKTALYAFSAWALSSPQRKQWANKYPDDAHYVFLGRYGHLTDSGLRYIIKETGKKAEIDLHSHQLRHIMAVAAFGKGAPPVVVSQILGHSSSETTMDIYSVFSLSRLKAQHEKYSTVTQVRDFLHEAFAEEADEHILW